MQEWRWCFFLAGICPIWYFAELLVRVMVFVVESQFFTTPQAMYFTVSIRVGLLLFSAKVPKFCQTWELFNDLQLRPETCALAAYYRHVFLATCPRDV